MTKRAKIIFMLLCISLLANVYQFVRPISNNSFKQQEQISPDPTCYDDVKLAEPEDNFSGIFMNNLIDQYFLNQLNHSKCEADYESIQQTYSLIWENEYKKILSIIQKKCKYSEDKDIFSKFNLYSKKIYDNSKDALLAVMLDNFLMKPNTPEKNSWGLGTSEQLELYKGMFYRNQCMLFIPYLAEEYSFPTVSSLEKSIDTIISSAEQK